MRSEATATPAEAARAWCSCRCCMIVPRVKTGRTPAAIAPYTPAWERRLVLDRRAEKELEVGVADLEIVAVGEL